MSEENKGGFGVGTLQEILRMAEKIERDFKEAERARRSTEQDKGST